MPHIVFEATDASMAGCKLLIGYNFYQYSTLFNFTNLISSLGYDNIGFTRLIADIFEQDNVTRNRSVGARNTSSQTKLLALSCSESSAITW